MPLPSRGLFQGPPTAVADHRYPPLPPQVGRAPAVADLGAGEAELVARRLAEALARVDDEGHGLAVDGETDFLRAGCHRVECRFHHAVSSKSAARLWRISVTAASRR